MILNNPIMLSGEAPDIVFRGAGSKVAFAGSGSGSANWHANAQIGDYGILFCQTDAGDAVAAPDGSWTQLASRDNGESRLTIFGKFITSLSNFTVSNSGDHLCAGTIAFGNVDAADPVNGVATGAVTSDGTSVSIPNPTTTRNRCYIVSSVGHDIPSNSAQCSFISNASLVSTAELIDHCTTAGWDGGYGAAGGIKAVAGAVNNTTGSIGVTKRRSYIGIALNQQT